MAVYVSLLRGKRKFKPLTRKRLLGLKRKTWVGALLSPYSQGRKSCSALHEWRVGSQVPLLYLSHTGQHPEAPS